MSRYISSKIGIFIKKVIPTFFFYLSEISEETFLLENLGIKTSVVKIFNKGFATYFASNTVGI